MSANRHPSRASAPTAPDGRGGPRLDLDTAAVRGARSGPSEPLTNSTATQLDGGRLDSSAAGRKRAGGVAGQAAYGSVRPTPPSSSMGGKLAGSESSEFNAGLQGASKVSNDAIVSAAQALAATESHAAWSGRASLGADGPGGRRAVSRSSGAVSKSVADAGAQARTQVASAPAQLAAARGAREHGSVRLPAVELPQAGSASSVAPAGGLRSGAEATTGLPARRGSEFGASVTSRASWGPSVEPMAARAQKSPAPAGAAGGRAAPDAQLAKSAAALQQTLAKIHRWMEAGPASGSAASDPAVAPSMAPRAGQPSVPLVRPNPGGHPSLGQASAPVPAAPRLSIGRIDVHVVPPPLPAAARAVPPPPAVQRRARGAARPAPTRSTSLGYLTFGIRQR